MYINPYKTTSKSAKQLSEILVCPRIKKENSKFVGNKSKLVINWGDSNPSDEVLKCSVINTPQSVSLCSNKKRFFSRMRDVGKSRYIPQWTESFDEAVEWVRGGCQVLCRQLLEGHSGDGIILASTEEEVVEAPLYVKYIPKKSEYRVHVFMGNVIDVQRKARNLEVPVDQVNWKIRSHDNGFIFARNEGLGIVPEKVLTNAVDCVKVSGLDFGAVDVIYNEKYDRAFVLEVNTAPGLEGETLRTYACLFERLKQKFHEIKVENPNENDYIRELLQFGKDDCRVARFHFE